MYEFDCQVGDLVHVDSEREARAEVTKVDSLCLGGTYYRVVHYSVDGMEGSYNELIGCGTSVLNSILLPGQFRGVEVTLRGMNISEACSIKHSEKASTPDRLASDDRVYDLQGRRMDVRHLPKGIYIQHGKKFVVK